MGGKSKQEKRAERQQEELQREQQRYLSLEQQRLRDQVSTLDWQADALGRLADDTSLTFGKHIGNIQGLISNRFDTQASLSDNLSSTLSAQNVGMRRLLSRQNRQGDIRSAHNQAWTDSLLRGTKPIYTQGADVDQSLANVQGISNSNYWQNMMGFVSNYKDDSQARRARTEGVSQQMIGNIQDLTRQTQDNYHSLNRTLLSQTARAQEQSRADVNRYNESVNNRATELFDRRSDTNTRQRLLSSGSRRRGFAQTRGNTLLRG